MKKLSRISWTCCATPSRTTFSFSFRHFATPVEANLPVFHRQSIEQCFAERLAGASGTAYLDHYATRLEIAFNENEHEAARVLLSHACRREKGVALAELADLRQRNEQTFRSVLRDLEADGYVKQEDSHLKFRSNLLREWWRKYHRSATS